MPVIGLCVCVIFGQCCYKILLAGRRIAELQLICVCVWEGGVGVFARCGIRACVTRDSD